MENQENPHQEDEKAPMDMRIVDYFVRIIRTVFLFLFWGIVNVFLGLFLGFADPDTSTTGRMIFFYSFACITLAAYLFVVWKTWRKQGHTTDNY
ncbi:hypothetical protein [Chitinophaga sancti]|uniref:Solute:sodium symporter small subunit n=1 Tax=Chitinophaga sancti TaxID=1004 RepID=A0A1K1SXV3_9BACT|nr:hypothetical protein [Chitinophaga sancti]WQD60505.1 hypothetical protein U0033_21670 [Chitinophaga sancti]WQG87368.1 hypothetical protein SR876_20805 [Chitinophaga sancti]SFW89208.1 hypothetical protein SAMN05661012_06389 [Chitinophaga sancti]